MKKIILLFASTLILGSCASSRITEEQRIPAAEIFRPLNDKEKINIHIYQRLTGVRVVNSHPLFKQIVSSGEIESLAINSADFLLGNAQQFASGFSQLEGHERLVSPADDLQDYIVKMISENIDFRTVLFMDKSVAIPVQRFSGKTFSNAEIFRTSYSMIPFVTNQSLRIQSGILTTTRFAEINYHMGTNRRPVKYIMEQFLCLPINKWKNFTDVGEMIRPDVDRSDKATFLGTCSGCHASLDPLSKAFSQIDYVPSARNDSLKNLKTYFEPVDKTQTRKAGNPGSSPKDDRWTNTIDRDIGGWRSEKSEGRGYEELGAYMANSKEFDGCMVRKVAERVCLIDYYKNKETSKTRLQAIFPRDGSLKTVFQKALELPGCLSPKNEKIMTSRQFFLSLKNLTGFAAVSFDTQGRLQQNWEQMPVLGEKKELNSPAVFKNIFNVIGPICESYLKEKGLKTASIEETVKNLYQDVLLRLPTAVEIERHQRTNDRIASCVGVLSSLEFLSTK